MKTSKNVSIPTFNKLSAEAWIAKFRDRAVSNENCLEDMACSKCGNREAFNIEVTTICEISDEGTERRSDAKHGDDSYCACCECGLEGVVSDFTIEHLDRAISDSTK